MRRLAFAAIAGLSVFGVAQTGPTFEVSASFAPNAFGSPSWAGYLTNAAAAIRDGLNTNGAAGPTQYNNIETQNFLVSQNIVTNFSAWNGLAGPAAPFENELGNRLHFGVLIQKGTAQIRLADLSFDYDGGAYSVLDWNVDFDETDVYITDERVGILYGGNGVLGGGDDTFITSGLSTQLVDALVYRGGGNATEALLSDPGATNQDKIDGIALQIPSHTVTTTYWLRDGQGGRLGEGSTFVNFQAVPEPGTMAALGLGALALLRRRKKA